MVLGAAIVAGLTCGAATAENRIDRIRPDAPELAAFGDHPVGVTTMTFTNPGQIDILNTTADSEPVYDRPLTVEVWYPAKDGTEPGGTYETEIRDGITKTVLHGSAARDADPASGETYPLIVISHGYPGNRFLMSHLGENLASKGYVAVSIDHTDSTYPDMAAFGSTLLNRPVDQKFVIDQMAALDGPIGDITDASNTGVLGYSMGGYGAMIFGGAGVTQASTEYSWGTPNGLLERHLAGSQTHADLIDPRVKAIIAIGPWGMNTGFWDAEGLAGFEKPLLLIAGGSDDVSVYAAIRQIFEGTTGTDRHLLTFAGANHNAAAPMPAPEESWEPVETLDFVPFEHYADAVWDSTRMNNNAQHFATAFFDLHIKGDADKAMYFDLIEQASDGVYSVDENGDQKDDHTYWNGFPDRSAVALLFETLTKGN
nr:dienelactone hydrolase [Phaeobacter marinintestinus]